MWKTLIPLGLGIAAAALSDVALAAPIPLTGPDYFVALGRDRDLQYSRTEYVRQVPMEAGNAGTLGRQQQLVGIVVSDAGKDLCSTSKQISPPVPPRRVAAVALEVVYTVPIDSIPANRRMTLTLVGTITPAEDVPSEDQNLANNRVQVDVSFPAGGKARCVELNP